MRAIYSIEENIHLVEDQDDVAEITLQLEELRDEAESALDNMPEHLRETAWSGQLLQQRVESCEAWMDAIDSEDMDDMDAEGLQSHVSDSNPGTFE